MLNSQKAIKTEDSFYFICSGCLSSNKALAPITDDLLYLRLLGIEDNKYSKMTQLMLCWECRAVLRKLSGFQSQIQQAYCILTQSLEVHDLQELKSLSRLQIFKNQYLDSYEHNSIKDETKDMHENDNSFNDKLESLTDIDSDMCFDMDIKSTVNLEAMDIKLEATDEGEREIPVHYKPSHKKNKNPTPFMINFERINVTRKNNSKIKHCTEIVLSEAEFKDLWKEERGSSSACWLDRLYKCHKCQTGFNKESEYIKHNVACCLNSSRSDEKPAIEFNKAYKCNFCDKKSLTMKAQTRHFRYTHRVLYQCKICGDIPGKRSDLRTHYVDRHKQKYVCDHCGKIKTNRNTFIMHMRHYHATNYNCTLCTKSFDLYKKLYRHRLAIHGIGATRREESVSEHKYCVECNKQFDTLQQYRKHLSYGVKHKPPKRLSVECPQCGKVFSRKTYMNNHVRLVHDKTSRNHCGICDKSYITGFALRTHIKLVHEKVELPRDKICDLCGRGFRDRKVLKNHILTHTGERPHGCPQCPAKFTQRVAMTTHLKNIHLKRAC